MKKILTIAIIVSVSISLAGCGKKTLTVSNENKEVNKTQFSKLSDWLKSGQGVKCVVSASTGDMTVKSQGKKVRIEGMAYTDPSIAAGQGKAEIGTSVTDGEWMYMWSGTKGTKINIAEMQKLQAESNIQNDVKPEDYSWEKWAADQEAAQVKYNCSNENFSADTFTPPSNVEFTDMNKILQDMKTVTGSLQKNINPATGASVPGFQGSQSMTQEEIEAKLEDMKKNLAQ